MGSYSRVVSAMNFHSWGDLWIEPNNYDKDGSNTHLKTNKNTHWLANAYHEFNTKSYHPIGAL